MEWSLISDVGGEANKLMNSELIFSVPSSTAPLNYDNPLISFMYPSSSQHDPHHFYHHSALLPVDEPAADNLTEANKKWTMDEECQKQLQEDIKGSKKRLSAEQHETLEKCFLEEMKPAQAKKKSLARELNLEPRQVAVWFQNRRARLKNRQLELLYDELKHHFTLMYMEKQRLEIEVQKLQAMLRMQESCWKQKQVDDETNNNVGVDEASSSEFHHTGKGCYCFQSLIASDYLSPPHP